MAGLSGILCVLVLVFFAPKGCNNKTEQAKNEVLSDKVPSDKVPSDEVLSDEVRSTKGGEAQPIEEIQRVVEDTIAALPVDTIVPAQVDTIAPAQADTVAQAVEEQPAEEAEKPATVEARGEVQSTEVLSDKVQSDEVLSDEVQSAKEEVARPALEEEQTVSVDTVASAEVDTIQPALNQALIPVQVLIEAEARGEVPSDKVPSDEVQSAKEEVDSVYVEEVRPPFMALRTNLLYDAVLVPNIGLEIWLGKGFTIGADWFGTWLYSDKKHIYWQGYGGYLTLRYYFGKVAAENRFLGHHVGLYGSCLTYDIEFGGKGYQAAKFGFGGGVEYGYSLYVGHDLSIDFNLGVGYQGGEYKTYQPTDDGTGHYEWLATYRRHWFGPTKAEISLKWLIGPMKKKQKGGEQ